MIGKLKRIRKVYQKTCIAQKQHPNHNDLSLVVESIKILSPAPWKLGRFGETILERIENPYYVTNLNTYVTQKGFADVF